LPPSSSSKGNPSKHQLKAGSMLSPYYTALYPRKKDSSIIIDLQFFTGLNVQMQLFARKEAYASFRELLPFKES
jgi:hypothetical protein